MSKTAETIYSAAAYIALHGLHTGDQFAAPNGALDLSAALYYGAHGHVPHEFHTDEVASSALIEASALAMTAIRAVSDSLESDVCTTEIAPGHSVPDYIEHVSNWAATAPIGETQPPTEREVIGRLLRTADHLDTTTAVSQPPAAA